MPGGSQTFLSEVKATLVTEVHHGMYHHCIIHNVIPAREGNPVHG